MAEENKPSKSYQSIFLIFLAAFIGGGVGAFAKISIQEIPPLSFTLLRFLLATLILLPFVVKSKEFHFNNLKRIVIVSLLATANVTLFIFGVGRTTATISQMLYAGVPLIAGIFSFILLKEKIYPKKLFGILIGFIGVLMIVLLPVLGKGAAFNGDLLGNLIILVAVCSFALYSVLSKQFQKEYTPLELTVFFVLTTTLIQLILAPLDLTQHQNWWNGISVKSILGVAYVGIFGTGIYYLIYQHAIKNSTPIIASMILYLQPIFAFLWASVLLGERVTLEFMIGAILAFVGVALVTNFGRPEINKEFAAPSINSGQAKKNLKSSLFSNRHRKHFIEGGER